MNIGSNMSKKNRRGCELSRARKKELLRTKVSGKASITSHRINIQPHHHPLPLSNNNRPPNGPRGNRLISRPYRNHRRTVKVFKRWITNNSRIGNVKLTISQNRDSISLSEEADFDPSNPEDYLASDTSLSERELAERLRGFCREMKHNGMI